MKCDTRLERERMCPLEYGLSIFGGKWKARITCLLYTNSVMRFNEIKKSLGNITDTVLTSTLKELVADEIVSRKQYNDIPPRVEYVLTEKGESILSILQAICRWSQSNAKDELDKKLSPCKTCKL